MFKCSVKSDTLREISKISSALVKDVKVKFSKDGILLKAADGAHVSMLNLSYNKKIYSSAEGEDAVLVFEVDKLLKTLSLVKIGTSIDLVFEPEDKKLVLSFNQGFVRSMTLQASDALEPPEIPKILLPHYVIIKTEQILTSVKASEIVAADEININMNPEKGLWFHADNKNDMFDIRFSKEYLQKFDIKENVESIYPLQMLSKIVNQLTDIEEIVLRMDKDKPLKLEFDLSNGNGRGIYLLAPRTKETN
jgi:proliferating cell nuclear antigen